MRRIFFVAIIGVAAAAAARAQDGSFSQAAKPEDLAAAGLSKLSPEELARLDKLVSDYRSGSLDSAKKEAAASEARARKAEADAKAAQAEADAREAREAAQRDKDQAAAAGEESRKAGFFSKAKALIMPGTAVSYKTVESRVMGGIKGWGPETVFVLENGQCWKVANGDSYYHGMIVLNPRCTLQPVKTLGGNGFQLYIDGLGSVRVRLVGEASPVAPPK